MTLNLKALGLALVAVFALSAVAASAASAQQGTLTSTGPVTLTATETGAAQNWFEAFGARVECPGSTINGHKVATTPHVPIPVPATQATLTPKWLETVGGLPNCKVPGLGLTATIDMNGCDFVASINQTTGGGRHIRRQVLSRVSSRQRDRGHTLDRLACQRDILLDRRAG